ncbi:MAG: cytochrome c-type biogenesis protein CcmH [Brevefilum sp.]
MKNAIPFPKLNLLFVLIVLLTLVRPATSARGQASTPSDDEVNQIASQLYCPICDNLPLDVCPLEACRAWRELIREQLAEGWTEREIKAHFVAQYGERVLGEPPPSGLNWVLYLVPPVVILGGLILLLSKMKRSPRPATEPDLAPEKHYLQQVERDLENLE